MKIEKSYTPFHVVVNFGGFLEFLSFFCEFFQKKRIFDKILLLKDFFWQNCKRSQDSREKTFATFCFIIDYAYQCYFCELYS
jgi:hypothetical protein